ncbi:MAG: hypothetical protein JSV46_01805 [Candidatus Aminicenantes bacterium]|nr:MAG: hypothetical protein JSV46_01805 [Candidatus Aminicenantes bacterium]
MTKKLISAFILTVVLSLTLLAQDTDSTSRAKHYFFNLSVFYPLSINQSKYDSTNINLTLLYGRVGLVRGFDLAAGVSAVENEVKGLQLTGVAGISGEEFQGGQISGLFSVGGDKFSGFQLSGGMSVCGDEFSGLQASGIISVTGNSFRGIQTAAGMNVVGESFTGIHASSIFNVTGESFRGFQASGIFCVTGEDFTGIQAAGIFSVAGNRFEGLQVSGVFNVAGDRFSGLQVGSMNVAGTSAGVQVGLLNAAGDMEGVQIGLVNYSKNATGVPVGLVNLSRNNGRIRWTSWASNLTGANSGIKFSINKIYSIVALGSINFTEDIEECLAYSCFYGFSFPFNSLSINTDIGYMYVDNPTLFRSQQGELDQQVIMLRASLHKSLSNKISLFAGGGVSRIIDRGAPASSSEYRPLVFAGLELF